MGWFTRCLLLPLLLSAAVQATSSPHDSRRCIYDPDINTPPPSEHSPSQEDEFATNIEPLSRHSPLQQDDDYDGTPLHDHEQFTPTPKTNLLPHNPSENQIPILHPPAEPPDPWPELSSGSSDGINLAGFMGVRNAQAQTQSKTKTNTLAAKGGGGSSSAVPLIGMVVGLGCTTMAAVVFG